MLVPATADAHLGAAAGDVIHCGGDFRKIRRVAVAHAGAHLAELYALRCCRECRHQRPRFMGGFFCGDRDGVEMVVDPDGIPRALVCTLRERVHHAPLLCGVDADKVKSPALRNKSSKLHGLRLAVERPLT